MAYDVEELLSRLANHYQIDRATHLEYGSCRLYRARSTGRDDREVWIYVPRPEVYAVSKSRAALTRLFTLYKDGVSSDSTPSLPEHFDFHAENETRSAAALVLPRLEARSLRIDDPLIDYASKQGAILRLVRGIKTLEDMGLPQPPLGEQAISAVRENGTIEFQLGLVFFNANGATTPALLFQPAFMPPEFASRSTQEVIDASTQRSGAAHVYALGAYCIHAVAGAAALVRVFARSLPETGTPDPDTILTDVQLWANIANSQATPSRDPLQDAERSGMPGEMVDLLMRCVAHDPARRPQSVTMLLDGLETTVGRLPSGGRTRRPQPPPARRSVFPYVAAGVILSLLAAGAALMMRQRSAAQATARTEMLSFCRPIIDRFEALDAARMGDHRLWAQTAEAVRAAYAIVQDNSQIGATRALCRTAEQGLNQIEADIIGAGRAALQAEIVFARQTGIAPADALRDAVALAEAPTPQGDPSEFEASLLAARDALVEAHDSALAAAGEALLQTLAGIRGVWAVTPDTDPTRETEADLRATLDAPPGPDRLRPLHAARQQLESRTSAALEEDLRRLAGQLRADLGDIGAELGEVPELAAQHDALAAAEAPVELDTGAVGARYGALQGVGAALAALRDRVDRDRAALEARRDAIAAVAARAAAQGFDEDADLSAALAQAADLPATAADLPRWAALATDLDRLAEGLSAEWQAGRAVCAALAETLAAQEAVLDGMPERDDLRAAARAVTDQAPATRADFARCLQATDALPRVAIAAQGREVVTALTARRTRAIDHEGVGPGIDGFDALEQDYARLIGQDLPRDDDALAALTDEAARLSARYADLTTVLARAIDALRGRIDAVAARATAQGFDEDADLSAALAQAADLPATAADLPRWAALAADLDRRAEGLSAEWQAGRAECRGLLDAFAAQRGVLDGLPDFPALARASTAAEAIAGGAPAARAGFAQCAEAAALIPRLMISAQASRQLAALASIRDQALAAGVDARLPGFDDLERSYQRLTSAPLPATEADAARLAEAVQTLGTQYGAAQGALLNAQARLSRLTDDARLLAANAAEIGLAGLPVWTQAMAANPDPGTANPFAAIPALEARIEAMDRLIRQFESGAFADCHLTGVDMIVVTANAAEARSLPVSRLAAVTAPGYMTAAASRFAGQHCLSVRPVSAADLQVWANQLEAREVDLRREIDAAVAVTDPGGAARNTSFFLARRYAAWLAEAEGRRVCVAPAELILKALQAGQTLTLTGAELTGSRCEDTSLRQSLVVIDPANPGATPSCVPENTQVRAVFRIASGSICGEN